MPVEPQDPLARLLDRLHGKAGNDLAEAVTNEVIERGGTMIAPRQGDTWGSILIELQLHGVWASGETLDEAIANWLRIARAELARRARVDAAEALITGATASPGALLAACDTLIAEAREPAICARATMLRATLTHNRSAA